MHAEMTPDEAQILIAVLTFAEGAALADNPSIVEALQVLRPWRSALLWAYLRSQSEPTEPIVVPLDDPAVPVSLVPIPTEETFRS